jgi:hypothetical protein
LPEQPVVLDRWGRQLNSTKIGPMQEGEDIILSCRVVGGEMAWFWSSDEEASLEPRKSCMSVLRTCWIDWTSVERVYGVEPLNSWTKEETLIWSSVINWFFVFLRRLWRFAMEETRRTEHYIYKILQMKLSVFGSSFHWSTCSSLEFL